MRKMKEDVNNFFIYLDKNLNFSNNTIKNYQLDLTDFFKFLKKQKNYAEFQGIKDTKCSVKVFRKTS